MPSGIKTPCGPVGAKPASFQIHLDKVEAVRQGIAHRTNALRTSEPHAACCVRTVPQIFHYDDCWYIQRQAAEKNIKD